MTNSFITNYNRYETDKVNFGSDAVVGDSSFAVICSGFK